MIRRVESHVIQSHLKIILAQAHTVGLLYPGAPTGRIVTNGMSWSSWNGFCLSVNQLVIRSAAGSTQQSSVNHNLVRHTYGTKGVALRQCIRGEMWRCHI